MASNNLDTSRTTARRPSKLFEASRFGRFPIGIRYTTAWSSLSIFRESRARSIDPGFALPYSHCHMQDIDFDKLLSEYRRAIDAWVAAIKAEEALANDDHSMVEMEKWDASAFVVHDAENAAKKARDRYKNALRKKNYGF